MTVFNPDESVVEALSQLVDVTELLKLRKVAKVNKTVMEYEKDLGTFLGGSVTLRIIFDFTAED